MAQSNRVRDAGRASFGDWGQARQTIRSRNSKAVATGFHASTPYRSPSKDGRGGRGPPPGPQAEVAETIPSRYPPPVSASHPAPTFDREHLRQGLRHWADRGVYLGTSSWKYAGWVGQLYSRERYLYRGRFAETRFERECLDEYAEVFPSVCVDAAYYKFPDERYLSGLMARVPPGFRFTFKVTDDITIRKFPNLPRFGARAGQINAHFLDADLFARAFLAPCEPYRDRIGVLIFEFSRFHPSDFARGRDFVAALEAFLGRLPRGWRYGVEIRNPNFLHPEYFAGLARHGVAHVFNSWEAMPSLPEQIGCPGSFTCPAFAAARLLLRPGRDYETAVKTFAPYDRIQDEYPAGRAAAADLVRGVARRDSNFPGSLYLYVNNRFEGNALLTIQALLAAAGVISP